MSSYISAELRRIVYDRAKGCCEYCLIPESVSFATHQIDHIIAQKHQGKTTLDNLALCCTLCNKHKGSDIASIIPETGEITALYHPRNDIWTDHFTVVKAKIIPLTPKGRVTVNLLQFNSLNRVEERAMFIKAGIINFNQ